MKLKIVEIRKVRYTHVRGSHTRYKLVAGSGYMESVFVHYLYLELEYVDEVLNGRLKHLAALHASKVRETNAPLQ